MTKRKFEKWFYSLKDMKGLRIDWCGATEIDAKYAVRYCNTNQVAYGADTLNELKEATLSYIEYLHHLEEGGGVH